MCFGGTAESCGATVDSGCVLNAAESGDAGADGAARPRPRALPAPTAGAVGCANSAEDVACLGLSPVALLGAADILGLVGVLTEGNGASFS